MKCAASIVILLCAAAAALAEGNAFVPSGSLILSEDNENYFRNARDEFLNREALESYIAALKGGKITHFFMGVNGQRTSYRTKVSEAVWDPLKRDKVFPEIAWTRSCRILFEKGIDPYAVWIKKCREIGISPWIEMRINDQHFALSPKHRFRARTLDFWRDHPELRRKPESQARNWHDCAFDFSHKEVRDYKLALVREFFENWDMDGVSIDFMRTPLNLTPGKEREQAHFLTEFMQSVRKMADEFSKKRRHKIGVAVRVPLKISYGEAAGINAVEWGKRGIVDVIIISPLYQTHFDTRADLWKAALGEEGKRVAVVAAGDHGFSPYECAGMRDTPRARRGAMTIPYCMGWADNCYASGADGLYLYNMMYTPLSWFELPKVGLAKEIARKSPRQYPITYIDEDLCEDFPGKKIPDTDTQLPQPATDATLKIKVGTPPKSGTIEVLVGFDTAKDMESVKFEATLNGESATDTRICFTPYPYGKAAFARFFEFPASAVKSGYNALKIKSPAPAGAQIIWAEIQAR